MLKREIEHRGAVQDRMGLTAELVGRGRSLCKLSDLAAYRRERGTESIEAHLRLVQDLAKADDAESPVAHLASERKFDALLPTVDRHIAPLTRSAMDR